MTGGNARRRMVVAGTAAHIDGLIRTIKPEGVFPYSDLLVAARERVFHGVALSEGPERKIYLLFVGGEAEGALLADSRGELYGNRAVYLIRGGDPFALYPADPAVIDRMVFSCRIYDKSHFKGHFTLGLPELGKKAEGVGRLIIGVKKEGRAMGGLPVRIRKDGQVIGNDITNPRGAASFRLYFGKYEVLIERPEGTVEVFEFSFAPDLQDRPLDLELS